MIAVNFNRTTAVHLLECLTNGRRIDCPKPDRWTVDDMLMLAGACFFVISSHGPWKSKLARAAGVDIDFETREAVQETMFADIHCAIDFISTLVHNVQDGVYEKSCDEDVAVVLRSDDRAIQSIRGIRPPEVD